MSPGKPPPRTTNRRNLRVPVRVELCADTGDSSHGYAINVSRTGMGLQSSEAYKLGLRIGLRFRFSSADPWIELDAEVIWCMCESDLSPGMNYCELGVRFIEVPPQVEDQLAAFVACLAQDRDNDPDCA